MAQLQVNTLSGMMIYTGASCKENAAALANRNFGFSYETLGTLTKRSDGDDYWTKYSSYIYSENKTVISDKEDIIDNAYAYVVSKPDLLKGDIYLYNNVFSEKYSYEYQLDSSLVNAVSHPYSDIIQILKGFNNSNYNKQNYYHGNSEVESIIYAGLRYDWQPEGTIITNTYTNAISYNVGGQYVRYDSKEHLTYQLTYTDTESIVTLTGYSSTETDESGNPLTYEYNTTVTTRTWSIATDSDKNKLSYTVYDIYNMSYLYDKIQAKQQFTINDYITSYNIYDKEPLYAYYISKADSKYKLILNTYSLAKQVTNIYVNYDGEYNDWFDNKITFSVNPVKLDTYNDLYGITAAEDYIFGTRHNTYVDISYGNVQLAYNETYTFRLSNQLTYEDDKISVLSPYKLNTLNFAYASAALTYSIDFDYHYLMDINCDVTKDTTWHTRRGCQLENLIIGDYSIYGESYHGCSITELNGLSYLTSLKKLDISGCASLKKTPNVNNFEKLTTFIACGSNIDNFVPAPNRTFDTVILPSTIKALNLTKTTINEFKYTANANLVSLTLDDVKINNIDTYDIIKDWIYALAANNLIYDGLVNYCKLTNVNWTNADVNVVLCLQYLGLTEFTGNIKLVGSTENNGKLTRAEYWAIVEAYGQDSVKNTGDLKFTYELVDGCYNADMKVSTITLDKNNKPVQTYLHFGIKFDDKIVTNKLIDTLALHNVVFTQYENSSMLTELSKAIIANDTYYPTTITAGDIVLYKGKYLYIFYADAPNIVNNYVKLGSIVDTDIAAYKNFCESHDNYTCSIYDSSVKYVENIKLSQSVFNIETSNEDSLQMFKLNISVTPENADNRNVDITYDTDYISSIETNDNVLGIVLTGKSGKTIVEIAATDSSNITATCELNITNTSDSEE